MKVFKNKLNENKNYLTKNKEYGQLTAFPLSNMLTLDNLEKSAPKGVVTALLTFFFVAPLDEVIYSHDIVLQQKDFCISVPYFHPCV